MPVLNIVITSTRPGRVGPAVAHWFHDLAAERGPFEARLVDLAEFNLPVYDEPRHPRARQYEHEHTRAWSESVASADAFVFVMPEYNGFPPPSLINALDFVLSEWAYKPASFVSYGGVSGGARAVQAVRGMLSLLKMMALPETVSAPMVFNQIKEGVFAPTEPQVHGAEAMLAELARWSEALRSLR